jgi:hypothetical protein
MNVWKKKMYAWFVTWIYWEYSFESYVSSTRNPYCVRLCFLFLGPSDQ